MRAGSTLAFALAGLLGGNLLGGIGLALAQQASGPPTPITPPPSVYSQAPPIPPPARTVARRHATQQATTLSQATTAPAAVARHAGIDCGAQLVVWANTVSRIYHFSTSEYYGNTKVGAWMCENDAKAQRMRPGRTEVRP